MIQQLIAPVTGLLDKFIPDADTKQKIAHEIATMSERHAHEMAKAQLGVNKTEAAHKSLFVAGWRPAVGWVCVVGMACNFLVAPIGNLVLRINGSDIEVPLVDLQTMMPVLMGMLGLGAMRTYEKAKGVQREK